MNSMQESVISSSEGDWSPSLNVCESDSNVLKTVALPMPATGDTELYPTNAEAAKMLGITAACSLTTSLTRITVGLAE